jgi:GTPase SAR1 family protein
MTKSNTNLNLFLSYSHIDEEHIEEFIKHIAPLKNILPIEEWYDRKIIPGQDFNSEINKNLYSADIIVLFISANFLASSACLEEKKIALELNKKIGAKVCPIILESCGWLDDPDLCSILALPTDGKPITEFDKPSAAWNNVYGSVKKVAEQGVLMKKIEICEEFSSFLQHTDLLSKAHSQKTAVLLKDIFVHPELSKYDNLKEYEKKINTLELMDKFHHYSKILIAGENQSGKTTLCKQLFIDLFKNNYIPVYLSDKSLNFSGKIENRVLNSFQEQYGTKDIEKYDKSRFVIILDDFHFAQKKEKHLQSLSEYKQIIIIVDDIFNLNFKNEKLIDSFTYFKIEEFSPSLRNELITKWAHLTDTENAQICPNSIYQKIDSSTELVNATLGKMFGNGIMPAHPFFILSVISTYEAFSTPLDQEITSQGYCYQALIYMYLRKHGVKNDEVDTYTAIPETT